MEDNFEVASGIGDPIKSAFLESKMSYTELTKSETQEGIVIIFYGAPFTDPVHAANKLALKTKLPILNIDQLIMEAIGGDNMSATENDTDNAIQKICEIINAEYNRIFANELTPEILEEQANMSQRQLVEKEIAKIIQGPTVTTGKKTAKSDKSSKKSASSKL